jgi:DNA-binding LacI/PurR family transcriptional regulator
MPYSRYEMATYAEPSLSSVSVNRYKMGKQAMELIFVRLNNSEISDNAQINTQQSYVNTGFELFMRNSTR